jgi:DNA polymerase
MGATAAQSLLGTNFAFTKQRGTVFDHSSGKRVLATYHPSAVLRAPDEDARHATYQALVEDLRLAWKLSGQSGSTPPSGSAST